MQPRWVLSAGDWVQVWASGIAAYLSHLSSASTVMVVLWEVDDSLCFEVTADDGR